MSSQVNYHYHYCKRTKYAIDILKEPRMSATATVRQLEIKRQLDTETVVVYGVGPKSARGKIGRIVESEVIDRCLE